MIRTIFNMCVTALIVCVGLSIVFLLLAGGLGLISNAFGQSVPTHDALPSEIDRSYNYEALPSYPSLDLELSMIDAYESAPVDAFVEGVKVSNACASMNRFLMYKVKLIASRIAANPRLGPIYADALNLIHDSWCTA